MNKKEILTTILCLYGITLIVVKMFRVILELQVGWLYIATTIGICIWLIVKHYKNREQKN